MPSSPKPLSGGFYAKFIVYTLYDKAIQANIPFRCFMEYMARHHEDLAKTFTDEQKEIFEKFHDCWDEYVSFAEAAIFEYAFRLGARLAMEVQTDEE